MAPSSNRDASRRSLQAQDLLELISTAAIPLMIAVISLWLAVQQQKITQVNRDKDAAQVAEVRKQDIALSRLQREEDRKMLRLQREEDKNATHLQREEDKELARRQREEDRDTARRQREDDREISRLQRELDFNITHEKRLLDYELAEKERNQSETQRTHELTMAYQNRVNDLLLEDDIQMENVLSEYQDDLAVLLLDYATLLENADSEGWLILQMKTGAALRQLDPARRTILLHTVRDAGILDVPVKSKQSIVYQTNLSGVDVGHSLDTYITNYCTTYEHLQVEAADLRYASFHGLCLQQPMSFIHSNLDYTDWSFATLGNIHFNDRMTMNGAKFARSTLKGTKFSENVIMDRVSFQHNVECDHCQFFKTSLAAARLDYSRFLGSKFTSISMNDGNMSNGLFILSNFKSVELNRVDLSGADLTACTFIFVSMINCSMFGAKFDRAKFSRVDLSGCKGLSDRQIFVLSDIYNTTLPNGTFMHGKKH